MESIRFVYDALFGPGLVTAPAYLVLAGLVAWAVWLRRGDGTGFWHWLLPAGIWGHPSHLIDLQLFILGRILAVLVVFGGVALTAVVAAGWRRSSLPCCRRNCRGRLPWPFSSGCPRTLRCTGCTGSTTGGG